MTADQAHPKRGVLAAYEAGGLADDQADLVEQHLRRCDSCRKTMQRVRDADPTAGSLREAFDVSRSACATGTPIDVDGAPAAQADAASADGGQVPATPVHDRTNHEQNRTVSGASAWLIPDYERIQLCGEGAYGSVWAVRDRVGLYRAAKIVDLRRVGLPHVLARAERERSALEIYCREVGRHPYLIEVYHVGVVGDQLYYIMELADNDATKEPVVRVFPDVYRPLTLATVIRRRRIRPDTAVEITRRLLRGLAKLHSLNLVHRDIKPANILIVRRAPKLADIGMVGEGTTDGASKGPVIGTPRYMPPDRISDQTADVFAIGRVLHEMIAGRDAETFPDLPPRFLTKSDKWDMSRVEEVLVRACAPAAAQRYESASTMLDDLEACADYSVRSLFEDIGDADPFDAPPPSPPDTSRTMVAFWRAVPWIVGFVTLLVILNWFRQ